MIYITFTITHDGYKYKYSMLLYFISYLSFSVVIHCPHTLTSSSSLYDATCHWNCIIHSASAHSKIVQRSWGSLSTAAENWHTARFSEIIVFTVTFSILYSHVREQRTWVKNIISFPSSSYYYFCKYFFPEKFKLNLKFMLCRYVQNSYYHSLALGFAEIDFANR